jgi:hypothetical protein
MDACFGCILCLGNMEWAKGLIGYVAGLSFWFAALPSPPEITTHK